jgi:8-oxo-dGTP pyrophosphatase MutT (NUDIX family)
MFDGRVMMAHRFAIDESDGGSLASAHFETSFSAFIAWRDFGYPDMGVRNVFSMSALRSADGAFLLGEMAAHTANGGMVYFPAGTPDREDVRDGQVDLAGSVSRELREETGLDMAEGKVDPVWTLVALGPRIACMRPVVFDASADEICSRVAKTLAREAQPELAGLRAVRSMAEVEALNTPDFIRAYLAYAFSRD